MKAFTNFRQFIGLSFFLFAMFLGAGNIIFAPVLGQSAGTHTWLAMSGFLITGVGLVLLAIVALSLAGGSVEKLAGRVNPTFAKVFAVVLFLTLGPIYVVPRTAAVVYEVAVSPFAPSMQWATMDIPLLAFSVLFMGLTVYLSADPGKLVSRIGEIITPCFIAILLVIVATSLIDPIGQPSAPVGPYVLHAFGKGFNQGYYTMDVLAAFIFGKIFIDAAQRSGVRPQAMSSVFLRCGLFTVVALALVQLSLAWMGATSAGQLGVSENGGQALPAIVRLLLGTPGVVLLAIVILLTGLTTAVGCLVAVSEYFSRVFPRLSCRQWVYLLGAVSLLITNFGLTTILWLASPVLLVLYPIAITLIALVLLNKYFGGLQSAYIGAVSGAGVMGVCEGLKEMKWLPAGLERVLMQSLPLHESGLGWIVVAVVGGVIGIVVSRGLQLPTQSYRNHRV